MREQENKYKINIDDIARDMLDEDPNDAVNDILRRAGYPDEYIGKLTNNG